MYIFNTCVRVFFFFVRFAITSETKFLNNSYGVINDRRILEYTGLLISLYFKRAAVLFSPTEINETKFYGRVSDVEDFPEPDIKTTDKRTVGQIEIQMAKNGFRVKIIY